MTDIKQAVYSYATRRKKKLYILIPISPIFVSRDPIYY